MRIISLILALLMGPCTALAQDRPVTLHAPLALVETGLFQYILPRFTLKHRVKVVLVDSPDQADLRLGDQGSPVFQQGPITWSLDLSDTGPAGAEKFADWLNGTVGQNTVMAFAPDGSAVFSPPMAIAQTVEAVVFDGDAAQGRDVAQASCSRCHVVDKTRQMGGIGSTPSFAVLRSLPDWEERFSVFYILNPHPSFTQIEDVTEPFDPARPSPIVPISLSLADVEAVLAYVAAIPAANLGAPLDHQ